MCRFRDKASRVTIFIAALAFAACRQAPVDNAAQEQSANETSPLQRLPVAEPPMDRAALLFAAVQAASAAALARDDSGEQRRLDGKPFEVRIRFGCPPADPQPQRGDGPLIVRYDARDRTLRLRAAPDLSVDDPTAEAVAGEQVEAVEGFWLRRPWLLADGCPAAPPARTPVAAAADGAPVPTDAAAPRAAAEPRSRRVGIAQFFTEADSRTARRDKRAYQATTALAEGELPSRQGYNLVLSGRLRKLPSGRVIACLAEARDREPDCIASAEFDRVWIENPETKQILAEWGN